MKGIVEIYSDYGLPSEQLLFSENNTIVDGFGEQMAILMTTTPSLSRVSYASALLDTSNYTVRAISFSKDAAGFSANAHAADGIAASGGRGGQVWVGSDSATSSYKPSVTLPSFTSPTDTSLEVVTDGLSAIREYGQNLNLLRYGADLGLTPSQRVRYGCWPPSSGVNLQIRSNSTSALIVSATVSGTFNTVSSMDWRGFVNTTNTGNPLSGLVVSAYSLTGTTTVSAGTMKHTITIASGDLACANLYGGIFSIGLWGLDLESLICDGRMPPYSFNPINTLDYKLFAKKSLTVDLTRIADNGSSAGLTNYQNLTLVWVFRFVT